MSCLPLLLTKVALREKRDREVLLCSGVLLIAFCLHPEWSARYIYFHFTFTFTFTLNVIVIVRACA